MVIVQFDTSEPIARHPLSALFSATDLSGKDYADLKESILQAGLQNPITLYDGQILDGWNRYTACRDLNLPTVIVCNFDGSPEQAWDYVVAQNMRRRSLTAHEKLRILLAHSGRELPHKSARELAKDTGVSKSSAHRLQKVAKKATDEELTAIVAGNTTVNAVHASLHSQAPVATDVNLQENDEDDVAEAMSAEIDRLHEDLIEANDKITLLSSDDTAKTILSLQTRIKHLESEAEGNQAKFNTLLRQSNSYRRTLDTLTSLLNCEITSIVATVKAMLPTK